MSIIGIQEQLESDGVPQETVTDVIETIAELVSHAYADGYGTGYLHGRERDGCRPQTAWFASMTYAIHAREVHVCHGRPDQ